MPTTAISRSARTAFLLVGALALCGCATHQAAPSTGSVPSSGAVAFPVRVSAPGGSAITIGAQPKRIISLDASDTEILYAVGAGAQVIAVDKESNYPTNAPRSALDSANPSLEAIAADNPDLVVTAYNTNNLVAGLAKIHVPVLLTNAPSTLDAAYALWSTIGRATGHQQQADGVVNDAKRQISAIVASTPKSPKPVSYYYELDQTLYTVTSHTFIGSVLGLFGLTNIADSANGIGYPQLSAERVISANPTMIFLADSRCCGQSAATIASRPGWASLDAVREGHVVTLNDDLASRWGPRIVDLMRAVASSLATLSNGNG